MPRITANSLQQAPVSSAVEQSHGAVEAPNHFGTSGTIQLYAIDTPRVRLVDPSESPYLQFGVALVEMRLHSPASVNSGYDNKRIWVALPNGESGNGDVNNVTAVQMYENMMSDASPFNCAIAQCHFIRLNVPNNSWEADDFGRDANTLLREKKTVMSDVLYVNSDGFLPVATFDHTAVGDNNKYRDLPEIDYEQVRENYKGTSKRLASHPVVNSISGYGVLKPADNGDTEMNAFHVASGIQNGIGKTNQPKVGQPDYSRNRYYFTGHVFRDNQDSAIPNPMAFVLDDSRHLEEGENSRSYGFESNLSKNVHNEFSFMGTLRVQEFKDSSAVAFRISISQYSLLSASNSADTSVSKDNASAVAQLSGLGALSALNSAPVESSVQEDDRVPWTEEEAKAHAKAEAERDDLNPEQDADQMTDEELEKATS